jgi:outer membrane lipoprotein SlyB
MTAITLGCVLALSGCTAAQKGAGIGATGGAILGAIIGHQSDHRTEGALVGAALGGLAGALAGDGIDEYRTRKRTRENEATADELRQRIDLLEEENRQLRVVRWDEAPAYEPAMDDLPPPPGTPPGY